MRLFVLIAGVVSLLMYGAAVSQKGVPGAAQPFAVASKASVGGLDALKIGLAATGASVDEAVVIGWGEVRAASDRDKIAQALGWHGSPPEGESRTLALREQNDKLYVTVRWTLSGKAIGRWQQSAVTVERALKPSALVTSVAVQVSGVTAEDGLPELSGKALDALAATDRQPWSDQQAASVAGRTTQLPPGPFGVNVQVAVRRDAGKDNTRVWIAWPALLQEY